MFRHNLFPIPRLDGLLVFWGLIKMFSGAMLTVPDSMT